MSEISHSTFAISVVHRINNSLAASINSHTETYCSTFLESPFTSDITLTEYNKSCIKIKLWVYVKW